MTLDAQHKNKYSKNDSTHLTGHRPVSQSSLGEGFVQELSGTWNFSRILTCPKKKHNGEETYFPRGIAHEHRIRNTCLQHWGAFCPHTLLRDGTTRAWESSAWHWRDMSSVHWPVWGDSTDEQIDMRTCPQNKQVCQTRKSKCLNHNPPSCTWEREKESEMLWSGGFCHRGTGRFCWGPRHPVLMWTQTCVISHTESCFTLPM